MNSIIEALNIMLYRIGHRILTRHLNRHPQHCVPMIVELCAFADKHFTASDFQQMQAAWRKVRKN